MRINDVIKELERIKEDKGNIRVNILSNHFVKEAIKIKLYVNEYDDEFSAVLEAKD